MAKVFYPELNLHFNDYWKSNGEITADNIHLPEVYGYTTPNSQNIFRMLFDNTFNESGFIYTVSASSLSTIPKPVRSRLKFSSVVNNMVTYESDSEGGNTLNFGADDLTLFSLLYQYRMSQTPDLSDIVYDSLTTNLSQMIYIYLQLMVNNEFEKVNGLSLLGSSTSVLDNLYETYLTNEAHRVIKNWSFLIDSGIVNLRPWRQKIIVTTTIESERKVCLDYTADLNSELFMFKNGTEVDPTKYSLTCGDSTVGDTTCSTCAISWTTANLTVNVDDILLIDYYTEATANV